MREWSSLILSPQVPLALYHHPQVFPEQLLCTATDSCKACRPALPTPCLLGISFTHTAKSPNYIQPDSTSKEGQLLLGKHLSPRWKSSGLPKPSKPPSVASPSL